MRISFTSLPIVDIEGSTNPQDFAKIIGNVIFNQADDVAEHDLGRKIYHEKPGEGIEISDDEQRIIRKFLPMFKYFLRSAIERAMDDNK